MLVLQGIDQVSNLGGMSATIGNRQGQIGAIVDGGVAAQTTQTMRNVADRLAEAGAALSDVVKTLCFLTDMDTFATFNTAYVAGFGQHRPARSTIGVAGLPAGGAVEIEAWAYLPVQ